MKVNIDAGTAALLSEVLDGQQDPGLFRLKGYIDQQLDKSRPSESLSADELQALIAVVGADGEDWSREQWMTATRSAVPKLRKMLERKTDPTPAARAVAELHKG